MSYSKPVSGPPEAKDGEVVCLLERPDGFYWQDTVTKEMFGPFATRAAAEEDMLYREDSDYAEGETLEEAEDELGLSDWADPDTGSLAEDFAPHLSDE